MKKLAIGNSVRKKSTKNPVGASSTSPSERSSKKTGKVSKGKKGSKSTSLAVVATATKPGKKGPRRVKGSGGGTVEVKHRKPYVSFIRFRVVGSCLRCHGPLDYTWYESGDDAHRECGNPNCKEGLTKIDRDELVGLLGEFFGA